MNDVIAILRRVFWSFNIQLYYILNCVQKKKYFFQNNESGIINITPSPGMISIPYEAKE